MGALNKFAVAAVAVAAIAAIGAPASAATTITFASATPPGSVGLKFTSNSSSTNMSGTNGGSIAGSGPVNWTFKSQLNEITGLGPDPALFANFLLSATSTAVPGFEDDGMGGQIFGLAGFNGSFSFTYGGADRAYSYYGHARTLHAGDVLLAATFQNAWIQGTGSSGSFDASTTGAVPATFTSVTSDVYNFENATDFDFAFAFSGISTPNGTGLQQTPNHKSYKTFTAGTTATFAANAVPEPATWGLMILGFGGAGAMIRRRRTQTATA